MNQKITHSFHVVVTIILTAAVLISITACGSKKGDTSKDVIKTIQIDGASMQDTFQPGQTVKVLPLNGMPSSGDVICFQKSEGYSNPMVKRVIAAAGQNLQIDFQTGTITVDGNVLDEPYVKGTTCQGDIPAEEINGVIPEGKVFVLGDNRTVSMDSRYSSVGLIDLDMIIGIIPDQK